MNKHFPCGHWHKRRAPFVVVPEDDVYWAANCYAFIVSTTKELVEIVPEVSTHINFGCCVDADYFYISNDTHMLSKYNKRTLAFIQDAVYKSYYYDYGACTDGGDIVWCGGVGGIAALNKADLSLNKVFADRTHIRYASDLTVDDEYLYVADGWNYEISKFNKSSGVYVESCGNPGWWSRAGIDIDVSGDYVFSLSENGMLIKADKVTWETAATAGSWQHYGTTDRKNKWLGARSIFIYGAYIYTVGYYGIEKWNISDLSYVSLLVDGLTGSGYGYLEDNTWQGCTDGTYIYTCSWDAFVSKWNLSDGSFVAENGDRTYDTLDGENAYNLPYGIACDSTHIYIMDQNDNFRIIKRLSSDLSYVTEYRSDEDWNTVLPDGIGWSNPQKIDILGDYLYISDGAGTLHRVNKNTMEYVDYIDIDDYGVGGHGNGTHIAMGVAFDGDYAYVADYSYGSYESTYNVSAERYTFPDFTYVSMTPLVSDYVDPDYVMESPSGITVDETYLYVADSSLKRIARFDKNTLRYIDEFSTPDGHPTWIAVDDTYLYVPCSNSSMTVLRTDYLKKYLKAPPFTEIKSTTAYHHIMSCDTAWKYQY